MPEQSYHTSHGGGVSDGQSNSPVSELAEIIKYVVEGYSWTEHKPRTVIEAVLATAVQVGREGQSSTVAIEGYMSAGAARSVALTKLDNVPTIFSSKLERYKNSEGQIRSRRPEFTTGTKPGRAVELCSELGLRVTRVGEAVANAGTRTELRSEINRASGEAKPEERRARCGAERAPRCVCVDDSGVPYGCNNGTETTPSNGGSERSDRDPEADEMQGTPGGEEYSNADINANIQAVGSKAKREFLDVKVRRQSERLMFLDLVAWARSGNYHEDSEKDQYKVISAEKIRVLGGPRATEKVWRESELIEVYKGFTESGLDDPTYVPPGHPDHRPKSRMFKVPDDVLDKWAGLGAGDSRRWRLDTPTPKRTSEPSPLSTHVQDENGRNHPELIDKALRILRDAEHKIDMEPIEEAEEILAERGGRSNRQKLFNLRMARETIVRQTLEQQEQMATIQNAYRVLELSGRTQFKRGGPMNLPGPVKALAYSHYFNYDIKSCHTRALKQVADWLEELGVEIDTTALDDIPDKYDVAADTGIPVDLVKIVEHAVKYGAVIPRSLDQAENFYEARTGHYPSIAEAAEKYAERPDEALSTLADIYEPVRRVVKQISKALLEEYFEEHAKGGWMKNACGVSFAPHKYDEGHEREAKAMAWMLQGLEAAFVHSITILSKEYDYTVVANEHDGAIVDGTVPDEAIERAQEMSGFTRAEFIQKDHADADDIEALYGAETADQFRDEGEDEDDTQASQSGAESSQNGTEAVVEDYLERRRRIREGEVPPSLADAKRQGFSTSEWIRAQRKVAT